MSEYKSFLSKWTRAITGKSEAELQAETAEMEHDLREKQIDWAVAEAEMVIERYWVGNAGEREIAARWLLTAYEANQRAPDHGK